MQTDQIFSALSNPVRRQLLEMLYDGECNAGSLAGEFDLSRPAISEHLQILRQADLVTEKAQGRQRIYALNPAPLVEVSAWLKPFEEYWHGKLSGLSDFLQEDEQ